MSRLQLERVLRATARIAGVGLALGCAPTVAEIGAPQVSVTTDVPDADSDTDSDTEAPAECADLLADLVADRADPQPLDDATEACCEEVLDEINDSGTWPTEPEDQAAHWACCEALQFPAGLACSPWGPPAPPAMLAMLRPIPLRPVAVEAA